MSANDTIAIAQRILETVSRNGMDSVSSSEQAVFHIYNFLSEFENNGLSGFLYNMSPDFTNLLAVSGVVEKLGRTDLASHLSAVHAIVATGPKDFQGTWSAWLDCADPDGRITDLDAAIGSCYNALWDDLELLVTKLPH